LLVQARLTLVERLRARRVEIERAVLARVCSISDPVYTQDAGYVDGLHSTVSVVVDFALAAIRHELGDSPARRRAECVRGLLAGEPVDVSALAYEFDAWHVGVVAHGEDAEGIVRGLAGALDRRALVVAGEAPGSVWAWLGGARRLAVERVLGALEKARSQTAVTASLGEPMRGLAGWRLTHRQAAAALPVAMRSGVSTVRYGHVALLASALKDELLSASLREMYLAPLESDRDGGRALRETLRAYFATERNVSSAAIALGVKRHTVTNRLRAIEERLERSLSSCATDIEVALRLEDIRSHGSTLHGETA
jgi:PucR C-terminal helix-turn-helix domain/GGDEF-like domain